MLDHEPDTIDHQTADQGSEPGRSEAPPAPRRRRAATRQAGPPSPVNPDEAESPVLSAEAPPPPGDQDPATASKPVRKRTAKKATDATKAPRKSAKTTSGRGATKAATSEPEPASAGADDAGSGQEGADTEAALDEIRVALSAELPPGSPDTGAVPTGNQEAVAEGSEQSDDATGATVDSGSDDDASHQNPDDDDTDSDDSDTDSDDSDTDGDDSEDTDGDDSEDGDGDDSDGDDDSDDGDDDSDEDSSESEGGGSRRRRRRRGGRRRRRGGGGGAGGESGAGDSSDSEASAGGDGGQDRGDGRQESGGKQSGRQQSSDGSSDDSPSASEDTDSADDASGEESGSRRRRRRRRRRGEDSAPSADDPADVVVRVREPRSRQKAAQQVTGIEGSTRMEAKRQRRREGREAGRRRAPILSEAEFLARRESVVRKMIIRQREELSQIAVLEDDILVEHYVDRESAASLIGNVYLGRVQNVLPSMEAAFIDIGRGRNAVLYAGEVNWDAFGANGQQRKVENVLKSGQSVLVQVTKDPVGAKGARLTSHITLPGRYIVYAPGGHLSGISRKLPDTERKRLKSVLNDLVPDSASVIVRTAAEGASEEELVRDVNRLKAQSEDIERKAKAGGAPKLLYGEPDLTVRIVRDLFTEDFADLIIQGNGSANDAYDAVDAYVGHVAPHLHERLRRWDAEADGDLFAQYRLDEQISKALERKVFLPSGGSLIIDRTEAMTVIDVNTGKFTGSGGNLEATVTSNNLEAAEEIVRQLRLRDIGGIIVIDFIDMVLPSNRELLLRRLVECLGRDRTRHQVAEVTSLGLVQMTRKKIGTGLLEAFTTECEVCHGRGYEISDVPVETQKQPDGGARDQQRGGGRGRNRDRSSGSGSNGKGRGQRPVPAPPSQHDSGGEQPADGGGGQPGDNGGQGEGSSASDNSSGEPASTG